MRDTRAEQPDTPEDGSDLAMLRVFAEVKETRLAVGVVSRQLSQERERLQAEHVTMREHLEALTEQAGRILGSLSDLHATVGSLDKRIGDIAMRLGAVEAKPGGGTSGIVRAYSERASMSEEHLRQALADLRVDREADILRDRARLDAEIETNKALRESEVDARRTRLMWVTRAVVFICGAGGLALIGAFARACGGG